MTMTTTTQEEPPKGHEVWARLFELEDENATLKTLVRQLGGLATTLLPKPAEGEVAT